MKLANNFAFVSVILLGSFLLATRSVRAEVKAWEGTIRMPTYPWEEDVNPKFWAMEGGPQLSTTVKGAIVYPYTMQDHLSRTKVDRSYKAVFLENEYIKVVCLPELGGRLHSVLDKTEGEPMFHLNRVIKPGMIAMRGAWISGGVEWNSGPHGHTVTCVSPVDVTFGQNPDGSAFLEINNVEKIFRTRWTVRVTLHPGKAYLDERIRITNPTDGMHPYYFWNCTAFPNLPGTRFIYPMSLGTDHDGREFFNWPIHQGKDLSWLKNYEIYQSIFAVDCRYDFFGAYDVDLDRGIVQVANHHELSGKKAWTWGNWDFGLVSQRNLTDEDGPYIEVQSGPLPTQSDYGVLAPQEAVAWREWWYPVHGLGDGFEYATRDVAVQTDRRDGNLEVHLLATARFPGAICTLSRDGRTLIEKRMDLSPDGPCALSSPDVGESPVQVAVKTEDGNVLASFVTPLPMPETLPPDPPKFEEKPDEELTAEEKYMKGRWYDRATNRIAARKYYEMALADDPGHVAGLRALAVLDIEAGLYEAAGLRLRRALNRDGDDGLAWYFLGVCHLRQNQMQEAVRCGYQAARRPETASAGYDLAGRAYMRLGRRAAARQAFTKATRANPRDRRARDHWLLATCLGSPSPPSNADRTIRKVLAEDPTDLVPRAIRALSGADGMEGFVRDARSFVGEYEFNMLETGLFFADLGMYEEAARLLRAACLEGLSKDTCGPLPLYYVAYFSSVQGDDEAAGRYLEQAARITKDMVFPSRPEEVEILQYAVCENPRDANAHLHLGNLFGSLGRVEEAVSCWQKAVELDGSLSVAFRNLGLYHSTVRSDLPKAIELYRRAIVARPDDQTLYRDLADFLIADGNPPEAIRLLETMPYEGVRRADVIIQLAQAYVDEERYADAIRLFDSTPYFVNWEGQDITWVLFNKAHLKRGQERYEKRDFRGALEDFEAALTYPENVGVGRSNRPQEAPAEYWKGKALEALGRLDEARAAWKKGAAGHRGSPEQNEYRGLCEKALEAAAEN